MLPLAAFWIDKRRRDGRKSKCRSCAQAANKAAYDRDPAARVASTMRWRAKNPGKAAAQWHARRVRLKQELVAGYGGRCTCCGESEIAFLTVEHVNGGGRAHHARRHSTGIYLDVINAGFPAEFTVLCMNCNFARRGNKSCPHQS